MCSIWFKITKSRAKILHFSFILLYWGFKSLQKFLPAHCGPHCVCSRFPGFSRNSYVIFQGIDWSAGSCLVCVDLLCGTEQSRALFSLNPKSSFALQASVVKSNIRWRQCFGFFFFLFWNSVSFFTLDPTEVYTWGNNTNFSLGHGNQESRQHPELVDVFARTGVYIKQVG